MILEKKEIKAWLDFSLEDLEEVVVNKSKFWSQWALDHAKEALKRKKAEFCERYRE